MARANLSPYRVSGDRSRSTVRPLWRGHLPTEGIPCNQNPHGDHGQGVPGRCGTRGDQEHGCPGVLASSAPGGGTVEVSLPSAGTKVSGDDDANGVDAAASSV